MHVARRVNYIEIKQTFVMMVPGKCDGVLLVEHVCVTQFAGISKSRIVGIKNINKLGGGGAR